MRTLERALGLLVLSSSTGNLLVDKESDIEKVISSSDRIVSIHSEDEDIIKLRKKFIKKGDVHSHAEWRNVEVAMSSTRRVVKIAERYNKKIHVLHVTTREEVDFLAMHKKNVTFETTPQHLTMYAPNCYDKLGTYAQMNPPLRTKEHYDRLWVAIKNDIVDVLGSDHAPHLKENKDKEYVPWTESLVNKLARLSRSPSPPGRTTIALRRITSPLLVRSISRRAMSRPIRPKP